MEFLAGGGIGFAYAMIIVGFQDLLCFSKMVSTNCILFGGGSNELCRSAWVKTILGRVKKGSVDPWVVAAALMKLLVLLATWHSAIGVEVPGSLHGAIFFTGFPAGDLVRLDGCGNDGCSRPVVIAKGLASYGGLLPWNRSLLIALKTRYVVQMDPWCQDSSCPMTPLVDVERALGPGDHGSFDLGGLAWCHHSLFIVFGGRAGASGVLRCTNCSLGEDCTASCSLVDGGSGPGKGEQQLSGFAAGVTCVGDHVLITDNSNFRVQAIPVGCTSAPCDVRTFASGLKWPLGIAAVGDQRRVLVTLDAGIASFSRDGTERRDNFSIRQDSGFLCEGGGRILVASGGDGNVVSLDPACEGPNCREVLVWNSTGSGERSGGAIAYMPYPPMLNKEAQEEPVLIM